ncbi:MAG: archaeal proteasome endopeptidase complex subunit alpha [Nitrososphaerales archaeon]|nr:archaeal proteasome endopeptidase complex subunit alpha [Nitrososphaerales archaeon]
MFAPSAGYDRAITIFSPDGRLYQVEYAIETVRRGTLALGLRVKNGVILAVEERTRKLQNPDISQKIFQVDDHIGIAAAGYVPDARVQVDHSRVFAQMNKLIYDEPVEVEAVAKRIGDLNQQYTQYAGVRPFGVSLILAGVDRNGAMLFSTDPSGTYLSYDGIAIGAGSDQVMEYLEKRFNPNMNLEDACVLAIDCIYLVSEDKVGTKHIKMALLDTESKRMIRLTDEEIAKYAEKSKERLSPTGKS